MHAARPSEPTPTSSIASTPAAPSSEIPRDGARVIWLLLVAAFVAILNETTMGIALPHLNTDLGIPPEQGQWLTSAFMLMMAVVIPTTGFLLQRFTTRQVFLAAMIAFTLGTAICLVSPGFFVLLIGRVVQAAGTGVMMPLLMTTVMNVVPAHSRGRMMGRVGLVISLAPAVGPILSGALLDSLGWRSLFAVILPIALISLLLGAKWMLNLGETTDAPFDTLSVVLSALGFGGVVYGLSQFGAGSGEGASDGLSAAAIGAICLAGGVICLGLFTWRQIVLQRSDEALLDLRTFASRNFTIAIVMAAVVSLALFGTLTLLPLYLQNVVGLDAFNAALILLPGSLIMGALGPLMGRIYDARGPQVLLIPGTLLIAAGLFFYATVTERTPWPMLMGVQTVMSIAMAMSFTPLFATALGSLPRRLYTHGSATLNTLQQVGGAAGVAILIGLYSARLHTAESAGTSLVGAGAAGARTPVLVAAVSSLVPVVLACCIRKVPETEEA